MLTKFLEPSGQMLRIQKENLRQLANGDSLELRPAVRMSWKLHIKLRRCRHCQLSIALLLVYAVIIAYPANAHTNVVKAG